MNRNAVRKYAPLYAAVAVITAGFAMPTARATNLLLDPGFEFPTEPAGTTEIAGASDWTSYGDTARYSEYNHTPGGVFGVFMKTFEATPGGWYQDVSNGVQAGGNYSFSGWYYFEPNFSSTDAAVDVELAFLGSSGNDLGDDTYTYIAANSSVASALGITTPYVNPPTGAWNQYTVSATAPTGTATVEVSFDWESTGATSGPQLSAFADDGDLEGPGVAPTNPTWGVNASGDWNNANNWNINIIPSGVDATANFAGIITANHNVYTDIAITVGTMNFNNTNKYVIDGAGSITLQVSSGSAGINVMAGTQEINVPLTLASNTVLNVSGGATLVMADPITINSGHSLTQTGTGTVTYESTITVGSSSSIAFGNSTHAAALTLQSSASATIGGTGTVVTVDNLSLASGVNGAKLDVGKNQLDVTYTGASPASTIAGELKTAYASGAWTGNGITSSSASFAQGTSVGYYDTGTQVNIERTWIGDLNLDGVVNSADVALMGTAGGGWQHGDLNYDGVVNNDDYSLFAYGAAKAGTRNISSVPEPSVAGLILAAGLLRRRRKA